MSRVCAAGRPHLARFADRTRPMFVIPLFAESMYAQLGFAAGCALLTMILLRRAYRMSSKRVRPGGGGPLAKQHRPVSKWDGVKQDADARFARQQVELHEFARDTKAQIDSKMLLLRELIAQSDRKIERLEELLERAEATTGR